MGVFSIDWVRVEANKIPDLYDIYGAFTHLPSSTMVFYNTPEIQIFNPLSLVNGVVYKAIPLSEFGYASIKEIDANYITLLSTIHSYDKTIDISDWHNSANYYYEPFTIDESSIIFYDDSTSLAFSHYCIIYVDKMAEPDIITVTGEYTGPPVPYGSRYDEDDVSLYAIYSDGERAVLKSGFSVEPGDRVITTVGSNVFAVTYETPRNGIFTCTFIVPGIKNMQSISVMYDGPPVPYGMEALRKYFVVAAWFSDGSSTAVSDFSFPAGNVISEINKGTIPVYYKGFTKTVTVPSYSVSSSRLMAYYNGPPVEKGHDIDISYLEVKIYYASSDGSHSYYEDVDAGACTVSPLTVDHEGVNYITVSFTGKAGTVSTKAHVIGIVPDVTLAFITAEYTGPEIMKGSTYNPERVLVKAHYTDGSIVSVKNFSVKTNIVPASGVNEFTASFKDKDITKTAVFTVTGYEPDSTMENGYRPVCLDNFFPDATRFNNRYRGPAEAYKHGNTAMMLYENITALYGIFKNIEKDFNSFAILSQGGGCTKGMVMHAVKAVSSVSVEWMHDSRFATGKYVYTAKEGDE